MKNRIAIFFAFGVLLLFIAGCGTKYHEDDFIGKTSEEIVQIFGPFDCIGIPAGEDGLYRNCRCGYTIKEPKKSFFGTSEEVLFFIAFDENGVASSCEEGYRPGG